MYCTSEIYPLLLNSGLLLTTENSDFTLDVADRGEYTTGLTTLQTEGRDLIIPLKVTTDTWEKSSPLYLPLFLLNVFADFKENTRG